MTSAILNSLEAPIPQETRAKKFSGAPAKFADAPERLISVWTVPIPCTTSFVVFVRHLGGARDGIVRGIRIRVQPADADRVRDAAVDWSRYLHRDVRKDNSSVEQSREVADSAGDRSGNVRAGPGLKSGCVARAYEQHARGQLIGDGDALCGAGAKGSRDNEIGEVVAGLDRTRAASNQDQVCRWEQVDLEGTERGDDDAVPGQVTDIGGIGEGRRIIGVRRNRCGEGNNLRRTTLDAVHRRPETRTANACRVVLIGHSAIYGQVGGVPTARAGAGWCVTSGNHRRFVVHAKLCDFE